VIILSIISIQASSEKNIELLSVTNIELPQNPDSIPTLKNTKAQNFQHQTNKKVSALLNPKQYHFQGVLELAGFLKLADSLSAVTKNELKTYGNNSNREII